MSVQILNSLGILSSEVPVGNLLWVDAVNGVDALAQRGRMTVPFRTLTTAKNAAIAGDTIMVLPGTYDENNLAKNGVNWHFLVGAVVLYTGSGAGAAGAALFDTAYAGGAASFKVTGDGVFKTTASTVRGFSFSNSGDDVTLVIDRVETTGDAIRNYGVLIATANEAKSTASSAVVVRGAGNSLFDIERIISTAAAAVDIGGDSAACVVRFRFHVVNATASYAMLVTGGTAYIDGFEVSTSGSSYAVYYACPGSHRLHLRVRRIVNLTVSTGAVAIGIASGSVAPNGAIHLYGCVLYSPNGNFAVSAGAASDVICVQQCTVKAKSGGSASSNVTARIHTFLDVTTNTNVGEL